MPAEPTEEVITPVEEETLADRVEEIITKIKELLVFGIFIVLLVLFVSKSPISQNSMIITGGLIGGYILVTVIGLLLRKPLSMKVSELRIFYQFTKQLEGSLDLGQTLDFGMSTIAQSLNAETGMLWFVEQEPGRRKGLFLERVFGMPTEEVKKRKLSLKWGQGISGEVARTGQGQLVKNLPKHPLFVNPLQKPGLREQLSVPLKTKNKILGTIDLYNKRTREGFHSGDLEMASVLAAHLSMAIDNAGLYKQVQHLADTDRLTELYNFGYFVESLEKEIKEAPFTKKPFSLIIIDVDYFKQFNDRFGHTKGNAVLKKLAAVFKEEVRQEDLVARFGGEEFIIILAGVDLLTAKEVGERIRARIERCRFENDKGELVEKLTISLGIAAYPAVATEAEELIKSADQCLYQAKAEGRNRVVCAQPTN